MINIFVNNKKVNYNAIWYHSRSVSTPGSSSYKVIIDLTEKKIIDLFERMLSTKITQEKFIYKACESGKDSTFNLVRWIIDYLDESTPTKLKENKIDWVFNTIDVVRIEENEMIIEGSASK